MNTITIFPTGRDRTAVSDGLCAAVSEGENPVTKSSSVGIDRTAVGEGACATIRN